MFALLNHLSIYNEINEKFKKFYILAKHLLGLNTVLRGTGATSGIHLDLDGDGVVDTEFICAIFRDWRS